jgi:hypothetical protein
MSTIVKCLRSDANVPFLFLGSPTMCADFNSTQLVGETDWGAAVRDVDDGKHELLSAGESGASQTVFFFQDDGAIPLDAAIVSVQLRIRHRSGGLGIYTNGSSTSDGVTTPNFYGYFRANDDDALDVTANWAFIELTTPAYQDDTSPAPTFALMYSYSTVMTTVPGVGGAWTRADLFQATTTPKKQYGVWKSN